MSIKIHEKRLFKLPEKIYTHVDYEISTWGLAHGGQMTFHIGGRIGKRGNGTNYAVDLNIPVVEGGWCVSFWDLWLLVLRFTPMAVYRGLINIYWTWRNQRKEKSE